MTRLLAITQRAEDPATRYRVVQFRAGLAARGAELVLREWPREWRQQRQMADAAAEFDAVVLQRRLPSLAMTRRLRHRARRLSFDFDDAIMYRDSTAGARLSLRRWLRFRALVRRCDAVTAGNSYLAALAGNWGGGDRVHLVPTVVEADRYRAASGAAEGGVGGGVVVGWIGQSSTMGYLEQLGGAIRRAAERVPGLRVRCIADREPTLANVPTELCRWSEATETADLATLSMGLAPLPDDRWTRGKCGLRLLQYLASGVPAIASPVGAQVDVIEAGGALAATTDDQWSEAIVRLAGDTSLRQQLIRRGLELVRQRYVPDACLPTILSTWCGLVGTGSRPRSGDPETLEGVTPEA